MKKTTEELTIISALIGLLAIVILLNAYGLPFQPEVISQLEIPEFNGMEDQFVKFALVVNFLYNAIPNTFQLLGVGGIFVRLLQTGYSPILLGLILATGSLVSQISLYFVGKLIYRHVRKKKDSSPNALHFLHKYHYLVYLFPVWTGSLGDLIMVVSGHERIRLVKALPVLFASNLAFAYLNIYWTLSQLTILT